jgi:hypothetical protein
MIGWCVVCSWRSRLVHVLRLREGICWFCADAGWILPPAELQPGPRGIEVVRAPRWL